MIELLKKLAEKHGWTQNELGRQLGLPPGHITDIMKGRRPITFQLVQRLYELGGGSITRLHELALQHELERDNVKLSARVQRATAQVARSIALALATCLVAMGINMATPDVSHAKSSAGSDGTPSATSFNPAFACCPLSGSAQLPGSRCRRTRSLQQPWTCLRPRQAAT